MTQLIDLTFLKETHAEYVTDNGSFLTGLDHSFTFVAVEFSLHQNQLVELFQGFKVFSLLKKVRAETRVDLRLL